MKTRLIFVRHAEAEGNKIRRFHGWTDSGITEKGHLQAKRAAERLKTFDIDVIYSSSLSRTRQTADYIAGVIGLPVITSERLWEINGGDWEDLTWTELEQRWPEEYVIWENSPHKHRMPNGESMNEFQSRLLDEVMSIIRLQEGKNICIVTHGTAIRAMLCHFRYCTLEEMINVAWCDNTAITVINYEDGAFTVEMEGDSSHLGSDLGTIVNQDWWEEYTRKSKARKDMEDHHMSNEKLVNWLFETGAVRVCPEGKPFWYTSGTIGPYYINTHFLYGSEQKALKLLEKIDAQKADKLSCPEKLLPAVEANYASDRIFKGLIDAMLDFIKDNIDIENIDYVSGGERRDWFFSLLAAKGLEKPHITIYKDLSAVITENGETRPAGSICGAKVLHIADLITEASSYERAWIPAIRSICGQMTSSVVVVDRLQGGAELLEKNDVCSFAMVSINKAFFDQALDMGHINIGQHDMLLSYTANPRESMKGFLKEHPEFLENALRADSRTKQRAQLCIDKGIYA